MSENSNTNFSAKTAKEQTWDSFVIFNSPGATTRASSLDIPSLRFILTFPPSEEHGRLWIQTSTSPVNYPRSFRVETTSSEIWVSSSKERLVLPRRRRGHRAQRMEKYCSCFGGEWKDVGIQSQPWSQQVLSQVVFQMQPSVILSTAPVT